MYFDLLFAMYHITQASSIIDRLMSTKDSSPTIEKEYSKIVEIIKSKITRNIDHESMRDNIDMTFAVLLMESMEETTKRFYLTESSDYMIDNFGSFVKFLIKLSEVSYDESVNVSNDENL